MRTLLVALTMAITAPAVGQFCPGCVQNTAAHQDAQINIGTATVRGTLTASTGTFIWLNAVNANISNFIGNGSALTSLNASQLASGTVPPGRLVGSYPSVTGLGTITSGAWNSSPVPVQYGGTGQNFVTASTGSLPYFSNVGTFSALPAGTAGQLLQTNGPFLPPSWTPNPQILGSNVLNIPPANLAAGTLPTNVAVTSNSLPANIPAATIFGNIPGGATFLTVPLPISNLAGGQLPTSNPASSITVTGVAPGVYGGPLQMGQFQIREDGRVQSAAQFLLAVPPANISTGALPSGVTIGAASITSGTLAGNVIASSIAASGVVPGSYGDPTKALVAVVQGDGRLTSLSQTPIALPTAQINPGALPAGVTIAAPNVTAGALAGNVVASSIAASGVAPGVYGGPTQIPQLTVGIDGRVTSAAQFLLPSASTASVAYRDVDNNWIHAQTSASSWTIHNAVGADFFFGGAFYGDGTGLSGLVHNTSGTMTGPLVMSGASATITSGSSITASAFFGDGSNLTGILSSATLNAEIAARIAGDTALGASTASLRVDLNSAIANSTNSFANVAAATATLTTNLNNEITARILGDALLAVSTTNIANNLASEVSSRTAADVAIGASTASLRTDLNSEIASRIAADVAIGASTAALNSSKLDKTGTSALVITGSAGTITTQSSVTASAFFGNGSALTGVTSSDPSKLPLTGGTLTGQLTLSNSSLTVTGGGGIGVTYGVGAATIATTGFSNLATAASANLVVGNPSSYAATTKATIAFGAPMAHPLALTDLSGTVKALFENNSGDMNLSLYNASNSLATVLNTNGNSFIGVGTGNFGIGTGSSPHSKLTVRGGDSYTEGMMISADDPSLSNVGRIEIDGTLGVGFIRRRQTTGSTSLRIFTGVTGNAINIDNSNNVGIGTTTPSTKLDVEGSFQAGSGVNKSTINTSGDLLMNPGSHVTLSGSGGFITGQSSITASAFFGDASHLTGVTATSIAAGNVTAGTFVAGVIEPVVNIDLSTVTAAIATRASSGTDNTLTRLLALNTVSSAVTFLSSTTNTSANGILVASSVTASAFFGNGSALTNVTASAVPAAGVQAGSLGASVIASSIAVAAVGTDQLANLAVTTAKIAASAVDTTKLASDSVTTVKILDLNVTTAKLAANSVTAAKVANNTLTDTQMAAGTFTNVSVPAANVNSGSLGSSVIASSIALSSVGTGQIVNAAVDTNKIASDAVTTIKILDANVTDAKLATPKVSRAGDTMTGALTITNSSLTLTGSNGFITSGSSITASAFFGNGSALTGVLPTSFNTTNSSFTVAGDLKVNGKTTTNTLDLPSGSSITLSGSGGFFSSSSSMTASAFFGNGSALTGISVSSFTGLSGSFSNTTYGAAMSTVTMTTRGGDVMIFLNAMVENTNANKRQNAAFVVDGAYGTITTVAGNEPQGIAQPVSLNASVMVTGLSAGSHTFAVLFKTSANTGSVDNDTTNKSQFGAREIR